MRSRCDRSASSPTLRMRNRQLGLVRDELVDADDHAAMLLDLPLLARRGLGDLALEPARLEAAHHAARPLDLLEQRLGLALRAGR